MCLAVPGQVVEWIERAAPFSSAKVEFAGIRRDVGMDCVPDAELGDYVLVHAGVAISRIDPEEAERLLQTFDEAGLGELERDSSGE